MGKAALDLPDPLEQPTAGGATPASADDLLSQLAGEEIDRLLAQAENDRPIETSPTSSQVLAETPVDSTPNTTRTEPNDSDVCASKSETPVQEAPAAQNAVGEQLDALFAQLDTKGSASEVVSASTQTTPVASGACDEERPAGSGTDLAEPNAADAGTTAAERSLLDAVDPASSSDATAVAVDSSADPPDIDADDTPLPIVFKPLVWINAPFAALSPGLRESLGKIAVLTLVNALAVLLYVLIFRR